MRARESEGERQEGAWRSVAWIRTKGGLQREAGGGRGARARATPRLCLLAEEEEDKGGEGGLGRAGGGAGLAGLHGEARYFFSLFFISVLFFF